MPATRHPIPRTCPFGVPDEYDELPPVSRAELADGRPVWLLRRYEDVRAALSDSRLSSDRSHPAFPVALGGVRRRERPKPMIGLDGAEHAQARRAVLGEFTVRRIEALRPRIQQIVDEHIDAMLAAGPPADLVGGLALPVPSLVICELLGVPYADHEFFQQRSSALLRRTFEIGARRRAVDEMDDYLADLIAAKEAAPGDDLLGRQIRRRREAGDYDRAELVSVAFLLLIAGHETTANMISLGTLAFLENPDQAAALRADPGRTLLAVEELLRYFSIADGVTARVATQDVEYAGQRIAAGEGLVALLLAANHDAAFRGRDGLDLTHGARGHVAFGFGPHQCIGQNLARVELQVTYDTLLRRMPDLRLATEVAALPVKTDAAVFGLYELPVTW